MHHLKRGNSRLRETLGASLLPPFFCSILLLIHIKTTKKPKETNYQRFQGKQRKGLRAAAVAYQQRRGTERTGAAGRPRPGRQWAHLKARTRQVGRAGPGRGRVLPGAAGAGPEGREGRSLCARTGPGGAAVYPGSRSLPSVQEPPCVLFSHSSDPLDPRSLWCMGCSSRMAPWRDGCF